MSREDVLKMLKDWEQSIREGGQTLIVFSQIKNAVDFLLLELAPDKEDDPFKNLNDTLIRSFSLSLRYQLNEVPRAIYSFKEFYQKCLKLESIYNLKIHKADTLHWIARFYLQLKEMENSFRYSILCFLDAVISEKLETKNSKGQIIIGNSLDVPICHLLQFYFQVPQVNIENLKRAAMEILSNNPDILDPENLVFTMRKKGHQIPRYTDYKYYNPSYVHLEKEYEIVRETVDDKKWEEFAALLFSAVEGFEPILDVKPGYSSYQFDVVIRNLTPDDFTIPWLGEYFAIECKYYGTNSVGTDDINHFASKLKYHDFKCGIIFSA